MQVTLQSFSSFVNIAAAAAQSACQRLTNLAVGSVSRALLESNASIALWLQYLYVQLWNGARLATSSGTDVDSFLADFGLTREQPVAASGTVTFSRSFGISALIVPYFNVDGSINTNGAQVITADGTQAFGVLANTAIGAWNPTMGGYFLPTGTSSVDVPVKALAAGTAGNVQANAISLIASAIPGVDTVNNATVFSNGVDGESDAASKARFQTFVATRARATRAAVENAIQSVQQNLSDDIIENTLPTGASQPGFFTVTIDDGTGAPPPVLINQVYAAIDLVRPIGSMFTVQAPAVITAAVNMTISASPGFDKPTLQGQVAAAIESFINGLGIGEPLQYTRLSALAFGVTGVATVSNVQLNGGSADIGGGPTQTVKATGASVVIN
jgi:uncharacterized phage protein gp47/JayE